MRGSVSADRPRAAAGLRPGSVSADQPHVAAGAYPLVLPGSASAIDDRPRAAAAAGT